MTPKEYINQYLDMHPDIETVAGQPDGIPYRDVARMISDHYGMDFDHTTVFRAIKKRRK